MQIALTLGVIAAAVFALVVLRAGPDLVLLGGLTILLVAGIVSPGEALAGFGNEGLVTVAVLFVIAEGLHQTGSITFIGQRLLGQPKSLGAAQRRIVLPSAVASAFLNNTPVVAMLLPVITDWSRKQRLPVSQLLLPLSYATILGGLCTLVGTSTTLVVNGLLIEERGYGLRMFEIAWVGLPATLIGLAWLLLFTRKLLPDRLPVASSFDDPREYTAEMIVDPASPLVGRTIEEAGLRHLPGVYLAEIERGDQILPAVASTERLQGNDRLVFVGVVESVVDLRKLPGLNPATNQVFKLTGAHSNRVLVEAVVSNSCPYIRTTIREARFRANYNAAVVAVARNGQRIRQKIGDIELIPGDTLLLEAHPSFVQLQRNSRDFFLVSTVEGSAALRHDKAWIARLLLAGMVIAVATGLLSMLKAALLTAGAMIATRCLSGSEARQSIDWSILLVIGAGLGLGRGLEQSGAAVMLAGGLTSLAGDNPRLVLALLFGCTMFFTNLITAKASAVLFFPIAMAAAHSLGADIMPFAVTVMLAAAASFATPIGYQTNLMVYGPGGYRFSDYLRLGGPLSLILWAVCVVIIPLAWPFYPGGVTNP